MKNVSLITRCIMYFALGVFLSNTGNGYTTLTYWIVILCLIIHNALLACEMGDK